jgi:cell division protein ZipA
MDWQIQIALIVAGLLLVGYIIYDYNQRKKRAIKNQRLIDDMRRSADAIDSEGFDIDGVSSARSVSDDSSPKSNEKRETPSHVSNNQTSQKNSNQKNTNSDDVDLKSFNQQIKQSPDEQRFAIKNKQKAEPAQQQMQLDGFQISDGLNEYEPMNSDPDLVLSLILQADVGHKYKGKDFMPIFLSQGLRHGDMQIFHRYDSSNHNQTLYKVASAIQPGTFNMHDIENFSTPAFAFFINLPGPNDPVAAYQAMVKSMNFFSEELGGKILNADKTIYDEQAYRSDVQLIKNYMLDTVARRSVNNNQEPEVSKQT